MRILDGQSALITGVGGGFGRAIALALARHGAALTLVARTAGEIGAISAQIEANGGRARATTADVRDVGAARAVYEGHRDAFGVPHLLVNAASVTHPYGPISAVDPQEWWDTVAVHVLGSVNYMTAVLPDMQARGDGRVINVCSMDGMDVRPNQSAYCVAKTAQIRLSEHVARENAQTGVKVFAIHPGIAYSPAAAQMAKSASARKWLPEFISMVDHVRDVQQGRPDDLIRCGERCVALASGHYDHLSGPLINFHEFEPDAAR